jgi:hypothetical protein
MIANGLPQLNSVGPIVEKWTLPHAQRTSHPLGRGLSVVGFVRLFRRVVGCRGERWIVGVILLFLSPATLQLRLVFFVSLSTPLFECVLVFGHDHLLWLRNGPVRPVRLERPPDGASRPRREKNSAHCYTFGAAVRANYIGEPGHTPRVRLPLVGWAADGLIAAAPTTAATAAAAAIPTAAAATTATASALFARPGLVDGQGSAVVLFPIQPRDGCLSLRLARHLDEAKALALTGVMVSNDLSTLNRTVLGKQLLQYGT